MAEQGKAKRGENGGAYERMRADILSLALRPGQDLDEKSLGERYSVSRTPIREAMIRLANDGLVTFSPNRGSRVTPLILPDFPRFLEALSLIRRAVVRYATHRRHPVDMDKIAGAFGDFEAIVAALAPDDETQSAELTASEHVLFVSYATAGHNGYFVNQIEHLLTLGQRMLRLPYAYSPYGGQTVVQYATAVVGHHRAIIDAIEAREADAAENGASALNRDLVLRLRQYIEENLAEQVAVE